MLSKFHKVLIGLLVVQLALVAIVTLTGGHDAPVTPRPLLAGFDVAAVTRVQIYGNDGKLAVDLGKRDTAWTVTSAFDYPAETSKITDLLSPLAKLVVTEPLATSPTRQKQLKVADDQFERRLVITAGG